MVDLSGLDGEVGSLIDAAPEGAVVGVVIDDLAGHRIELGRTPQRAASIIKVPIMTATLEAVAAGRLSLTERLPLDGVERVDPSGVLCILDDLEAMSVHDLITLMIAISDNMATNMLIDAVGFDAVNDSMAAAGMTNSVLRRPLNTTDPRWAGVRNQLTVLDAATAVRLIAVGDGVYADRRLREVALTALLRQQHVDLLPRYLPAGLRLAHKTGSLDGLRHDAGIVLRDGQPLAVIAAHTDGFPSSGTDVESSDGERQAEDLVAAIGRAVYARL